MFIKNCVFSLKFCDFSELCQFCCSAGFQPAWCVYTHWHRGKTESRILFKNRKKTQYLMNTLYKMAIFNLASWIFLHKLSRLPNSIILRLSVRYFVRMYVRYDRQSAHRVPFTYSQITIAFSFVCLGQILRKFQLASPGSYTAVLKL